MLAEIIHRVRTEPMDAKEIDKSEPVSRLPLHIFVSPEQSVPQERRRTEVMVPHVVVMVHVVRWESQPEDHFRPFVRQFVRVGGKTETCLPSYTQHFCKSGTVGPTGASSYRSYGATCCGNGACSAMGIAARRPFPAVRATVGACRRKNRKTRRPPRSCQLRATAGRTRTSRRQPSPR